uniref:G-protein coupled receptors family 1 profile domain-containing protein n=1 Tax=Romanomermis culicivorax TaxID=13658 RepID=A0A915JRE8_ROMCU
MTSDSKRLDPSVETFDYENFTIQYCQNTEEIHELMISKIFFAFLYIAVCSTAVLGNSLVIYVVVTNRAMQTVTNLFITNLAVSDLVVNLTSLWVTPLYTYLGHWIWGEALCHAVPLFQGTSIFISSLTLTAIAIDRYTVILYPFRPRMSVNVCITVIIFVWLVSLMLVAPYAVHMKLEFRPLCKNSICKEVWAYPHIQIVYGFVVLALQFGVPFLVISFCYGRIWIDMILRQARLNRRSDTDIRRKRRMLKMLVCMVVVFALCWLPPNILNIMKDSGLSQTNAFVFLFLLAHVISMTSSMWNPFLYGFLNDNFRREFMAVLPCFTGRSTGRLNRPYSFSKNANESVINGHTNDRQQQQQRYSPDNQQNRYLKITNITNCSNNSANSSISSLTNMTRKPTNDGSSSPFLIEKSPIIDNNHDHHDNGQREEKTTIDEQMNHVVSNGNGTIVRTLPKIKITKLPRSFDWKMNRRKGCDV